MSRKPIPKKIREQIYQKYGGHCAYCGCKLEYKDMQVDHVTSVFYLHFARRPHPTKSVGDELRLLGKPHFVFLKRIKFCLCECFGALFLCYIFRKKG